MPTRIEQTQDGQYVAIVETPGRQPQRYYGKDHAEIIQKLGQAQENASRRILELRTSAGRPDPVQSIPSYEGKNLSADESFKLGQELGDPAKAAAAIDRVIEARLGAKPEEIRQTLAAANNAIARDNYRREGLAFMAAFPDYITTPENEKKMLAYLEAHEMGVTARNFALAYEELSKDGLLETGDGGRAPLGPTQDSVANQPPGSTSTAGTEAAGTAANERPRPALTGLPGGKAVTGTVPRRPGGLTDEEFLKKVHNMSAAEYDREILGSKENSARLEKLLAPKAPRGQ